MGLFSNSYHDLCRQGIKALQAGNLERASNLFMKAIDKDQSQPRAFGWLGTTYQKAADSIRDDATKRADYINMAIRAFDEAIKRENDTQLKAEFWWQRGVVLGGIGLLQERDQSFAEADKTVPGFTARKQSLLEEVISEFKSRNPQ